MDGFIEYLQSLGTLSDNSIKDDISRMNSMKSRGIDYTKGEKYARKYLGDSNLSDSTVKSCLRLCKRYEEYNSINLKHKINNLADAMFDLYYSLTNRIELRQRNITVLDEFISNEKFLGKFYEKYVDCNIKNIKVVLCGINPGRYGAGKTGIPFMDFSSLSEFLPDVQRSDSERSAEFFYSVIKKYGIEKFYSKIYVTNICSVGFMKDNKNYNYYKLPENIKSLIYKNFLYKIKIIKPHIIIPLAQEVEKTLKNLKSSGQLDNILIKNRLNHPFFLFNKK